MAVAATVAEVAAVAVIMADVVVVVAVVAAVVTEWWWPSLVRKESGYLGTYLRCPNLPPHIKLG